MPFITRDDEGNIKEIPVKLTCSPNYRTVYAHGAQGGILGSYHKITRLAVDWCIEHNVKTLVIGDVTGIAQNTKSEKRLNRKNRQKISQWEFYKQRQYFEYKCDEVGIEVVLESENGTSKTCPQCGHKQKPNGRNYNCPACNLKIHRDVVGACNIRTKHLTGVLNGNDNFESPKVKYLRIDDKSRSSSAAGVSRRKQRKPYRRRLDVPAQLTLFSVTWQAA